MNTMTNSSTHSWSTRWLRALAQQEAERGSRVFLRLGLALTLAAAILWFTIRPFGTTPPPLYWIGFRVGEIMASVLVPLIAVLYGVSAGFGARTPDHRRAARHWLLAGVALLIGTTLVNFHRVLSPLITGHWVLTGGQVVVLVGGAFVALATQGVLLALLRSGVALWEALLIWGGRRFLRRRGLFPTAS